MHAPYEFVLPSLEVKCIQEAEYSKCMEYVLAVQLPALSHLDTAFDLSPGHAAEHSDFGQLIGHGRRPLNSTLHLARPAI